MSHDGWIAPAAAALMLLTAAAGVAQDRAGVTFYVAVNGSDAWTGRLPAPNKGKTDGPFATLTRARDAVRRVRASGKGAERVTVLVRGGTYFLSAPLVLQPQDSGDRHRPVTYAAYPGEKPVLTGGRPVTGWKRGEGEVWTAEILEVKAGRLYFRDLFVNGHRRRRARLPREGHCPLAGGAQPEDRAFQFRPGDLRADWANLGDVELVVLQYWTEARLRIAKIDEPTHTVTCTAGSWRPLTWSRGYYADNVYEGLGAPGDWYLNRKTGVLHYRPLPGEDLTKSEVIAPMTEQLLRLEGNADTGARVHDLTFRGLTLQHTAWTIPEHGHAYPQAELPASAAVSGSGVARCAFEECELSHLGGWGIELGRGCKDNRIARSRFEDIGAGGIKIGEPENAAKDADEASGTAVEDNTLAGGCRTYFGSPAIWIGQSSGNTVAHNEVTGSWMWAISVGWNWSYLPPNRSRDNLIEANHLHHLGAGVLGMHGALYCLGVQPGTVVRRNLIHDLQTEPLTSDGIILDNGCGAILVEDNVVHHAGRVSFCFNFNCLGNVIQNNIFALAASAEINRYGDPPTAGMEPPPNANFWFRNLCYLKTGKVYIEEQWLNFQTICDYNLYWAPGGQPIRFLTFGFEEWKTKHLDVQSLVADPLFVDPERGDFALRSGSPAFRLGFRPIDVRDAGPRGRR